MFSDTSLLKAKPKWLVQSLADIARHEGFREFAYPDPLSKLARVKANWGFQQADLLLAKLGLSERDGRPWTVGYGFTRNVTPAHRIGKQAADKVLEQEILLHTPILDKLIPSWTTMPLFAQTVLVNLAFNLGNRLAQFGPTLELFKEGKYQEAGNHLKQSAWFRQVGARGEELVERLMTGKIQDKYKVI